MDLAIGVAGGLEIIIWRLNRFGPHRVLQGHTDWVECLLIVYRKPPKIAEEEHKKEVPRRVKFTGPSNTERPSEIPKAPVVVAQPGSLFDTEVYSASADGTILKWKPSAGNCDTWTLHEYAPPCGSPVLCMTYDQGLDLLITGSEDCKIRIWGLDKQPSQGYGADILRGHEDKVVGVCVHNHEILISASYDRSMKWWNLPLLIPIDSIDFAHDMPIEAMEYSPPRAELATCGGGNFFKIWNATKKKYVQTITGGNGNIITIKWCNLSGGLWVTACDEGEVAIWDPDTGAQLKSMCLKKEPVTSLFVDEFNQLVLMSMLSDHLVRGYNMDLDREMCNYIGHTDQIHSIIYFPQRRQYISGSWDNTLRAWLVPDPTAEPKPAQVMKPIDSNEVDPLHEEPLISTYEKEYPLIPPKTLLTMGALSHHPIKRPESKDSSTGLPAPTSSLPSPAASTTSSPSSNDSRRSYLQLAKRLEDIETILKP